MRKSECGMGNGEWGSERLGASRVVPDPGCRRVHAFHQRNPSDSPASTGPLHRNKRRVKTTRPRINFS
jgi:hypothetical protein